MNNFYVWVDKSLNTITTLPDFLPINWKNFNGLNNLPEEKLNELGWYKLDDENLLEYEYSDSWLTQVKYQLIDEIANQRWEAQTNAISYNGNFYRLNESTVNSLYQKRMIVSDEPSSTFFWKTNNGMVELNKENVIKLTNFINSYIQSCFDIEKNFVDSLKNVTNLEDLLKVNLYLSWPNTTVT